MERKIISQKHLGLVHGGKNGSENIEPDTFPLEVVQLIYAKLKLMGHGINPVLSQYSVQEEDGTLRPLTRSDLLNDLPKET